MRKAREPHTPIGHVWREKKNQLSVFHTKSSFWPGGSKMLSSCQKSVHNSTLFVNSIHKKNYFILTRMACMLTRMVRMLTRWLAYYTHSFCTFLCRYFARLQLPNYTFARFMEMSYVFLFTFFSLPLIFIILKAASISLFLTTTTKFSCCSSNKICLLCFSFFISCSTV